MTEFTLCIETVDNGQACGLPAEITDRFSMESTDGPIEHISVVCVSGRHRLVCEAARFAIKAA